MDSDPHRLERETHQLLSSPQKFLVPDDVSGDQQVLGVREDEGHLHVKEEFMRKLSRQESATLASQFLQQDDSSPLTKSIDAASVYGSIAVCQGESEQEGCHQDAVVRRRNHVDSLTQSLAGGLGESYRSAAAAIDDATQRLELHSEDLGRARLPVALCCCYMAFLPNVFIGGLGVLYVPLLQAFNASSAQTGLVQSLCNGLLFGGGFVGGVVVSGIGAGRTSAMGSILATSGCLASSFAQSIPTLIATVGILTGSGLSLIFVSAWSAIGQLSTALPGQLPMAMGIVSGLGTLLGPFLISAVLEAFGWRGVYLILGGLALQVLPAALFIHSAMRRVRTARKKQPANVKRRSWRDVMHPELLTQWRYVMYSVISIPWFATVMAPNLFIVDIALDLGIGIDTGSLCLAAIGGASVAGRITPALFDRLCGCPSIITSAIFSLVGGFAVAAFSLTFDLWTLMANCALFGICFGASCMCLAQVVLDELKFHDSYAAAIGFNYGFCGLGDIISGPLGGFIRDSTGRYDLVLWACGVVGVLQAIMLVVLRCSCRGRPANYRALEEYDTVRSKV